MGPVPPDTLWVGAGQAWYHPQQKSSYPDAYLALYHDQGLIPLKLLAFDQAVNTTIGLPFIRTSPDHGTAFDIAGQGIARSESLKAAIALASEMLRAHSDHNNFRVKAVKCIRKLFILNRQSLFRNNQPPFNSH